MSKLIRKKILKYKGDVIDLHISNTHTYNVEGKGVHNSGGGSLVNYLLGITQLDPIPYNLLWSRFLGRHRVSWPDIDTDAGDRDELINAARELYGNDAVIPVSNFNTLKLKSLVKDIAKFYDIPFDEVNKVTGPLQEQVMQLAMDKNQEKSVFVLKHEDCMKYSVEYNEFMTKYPEVAEHVETLFMQNRAIGRHAGGVIIADADKLEQSMPIVGVRGELQTPWTEGMNFRNLEDNGFLKFDFLGLTLLKDVENCIYRILKKQGNLNPTFADARSFFDKHLNCRYVKQDDLKVWEHVYKNGRFCGIFQFTACLTETSMITMSDYSKKSIKDVLKGDVVISYNEEKKCFEEKEVLEFYDQGDKECIEIQLESGLKIECTYDHKFLTSNRGWIEAIDLNEEDDIIEFNKQKTNLIYI